MGGNIAINGYTAQPILLSTDLQTNLSIWREIRTFVDDLSEAFLDRHQWPLTVKHPFTGSTRLLAENPYNFGQIRSRIGDIDLQVYKANRAWLVDLLYEQKQFGDWTVLGGKGHGEEYTILIGKPSDEWYLCNPPIQKYHPIYQVDFQFADDPASKKQVFMHSSPLEDLEKDIKGAYHKILLNAVGGDEYKFSITHGLRRRDTNEDIPFELWGDVLADGGKLAPIFSNARIGSFTQIIEYIAHIKTPEEQQMIFNKFVDSCSNTLRHDDSSVAIEYFRNAITPH